MYVLTEAYEFREVLEDIVYDMIQSIRAPTTPSDITASSTRIIPTGMVQHRRLDVIGTRQASCVVYDTAVGAVIAAGVASHDVWWRRALSYIIFYLLCMRKHKLWKSNIESRKSVTLLLYCCLYRRHGTSCCCRLRQLTCGKTALLCTYRDVRIAPNYHSVYRCISATIYCCTP